MLIVTGRYSHCCASLAPTPLTKTSHGPFHGGPVSNPRAPRSGGNGEVYLAEDTRLHRRVALKTLAGTARIDAPKSAAGCCARRARRRASITRTSPPSTTCWRRTRACTSSWSTCAGSAWPRACAGAALGDASARHRPAARGRARARARAGRHPPRPQARQHRPRPDGRSKILDFGLARLEEAAAGSARLDSSTSSERRARTVGTPPYIPPEHLLGAPVDARGDIYSLGVTLFELLTGRRPFEAKDGLRLAEAILTAPTPRPRLSPRGARRARRGRLSRDGPQPRRSICLRRGARSRPQAA